MGREAGFGVNRLSTKRVHHTAKNARFHGYRRGYRPSKAGAAAGQVHGAHQVHGRAGAGQVRGAGAGQV